MDETKLAAMRWTVLPSGAPPLSLRRRQKPKLQSTIDSPVIASAEEPMPAALCTFLQTPHESETKSSERPTKRRRLAPVTGDQHEAGAEGDRITIARRDLDIYFADSKTDPYAERLFEESPPRPVLLRRLETPESRTFHLAVTNLDGEALFDVEITAGSLDTILREYGHKIHLSRSRQGNADLVSDLKIVDSRALLLAPADGSHEMIRLRLGLKWPIAHTYADVPSGPPETAEQILSHAFPKGQGQFDGSWSPLLFYESVHVPDKSEVFPREADLSALQCNLYPFQKRALRWLLRREHVDLDDSGNLVAFRQKPENGPPSFFQTTDAQGSKCYASHLYSCVATDLKGFRPQHQDICGGILAEEMGLGKTVELIALMCLHKRNEPMQDPTVDSFTKDTVYRSPATLIITPLAILQQWRNELATHAPFLKFVYYEGLSKGHSKKKSSAELVEELRHCDVVLTTYATLASEIHYAAPAPERNLRHGKKYEARRSPLIQISWWRVCLDEAQMVESGVSNAAKVACMIPRCNAWAVSGTPVRKDTSDLLGLLIFLRCEPYCHSSHLWYRLQSSYQANFRSLFGQLALRHNKDQVRDELLLPPQKRVVITIPFTQIEEQNYSHMFQQMCEDCELDRDGAPTVDSWDPENSRTIEKMGMWLTRLRQTCLHPEVGHRNRRALGHMGGVLRSVGEVLEVMIDQNDLAMRTEERNFLMSMIRRGQILESRHQTREALVIWSDALEQSELMVTECRAQLQQEAENLAKSKQNLNGTDAKGTAIQAVKDDPESDSADEDSSADDIDRSSADRQKSGGKLAGLRSRLRTALEVEHIAAFFVATATYQIKSNEDLTQPDSEEFKRLESEETALYERAKSIRKELLSEISRRVGRLMRRLARKAEAQSFVEVPEILAPKESGGIETRKIIEKAELLGAALNDQANQLDEWRETMVQMLLLPLVDEDEGMELQGDEYEISTKQQDEVYAYMEALRAVVADRQAALTGQQNNLVSQDMKQALAQAKRGEGPHPELIQSLLSTRESLKPNEDFGNLRETIASLRSLVTSLRFQETDGSTRARAELAIVEKLLKNLQTQSNDQTKALSGLERELEIFRQTMNTRLEYYRQLQQISDTVATYEDEAQTGDVAVLSRMIESEKKLATQVASLKSKRRYLLHLRADTSDKEAQRICIICQTEFEIGALTVCGHQYCRDCMRLWWNEHRSCPVCKKRLKPTDLHQITYKPQELQVREEAAQSTNGELGEEHNASIYADINSNTLTQIKNIDIDGSFGTKIDTLARHLMWIRENDAGAKSIVFSQYREFLDVLERAFARFGVRYTRIDASGSIEKFRSDPEIETFLLHAKAHSSGLNLVNATHVFLCEPLINTALELQAIARVHRIGQHRPTTVWMYLINDTVEESIYEISVGRRLAHMKRHVSARSGTATPTLKESTIDAANSLELQQTPLAGLLTKGPKDGEVVKTEDLWRCLFGKGRPRSLPEQAAQEDFEIARNLPAHAAEARQVASAASNSMDS